MATSMRQMKKNVSERQTPTETQGPAGVLSQQAQGQDIDPQTKQQIDVYSTMLTKFIHGKETQAQVLKMLQAGDPIKAIPPAAIAINEQAEQAMKTKPSTDVVLGASVTLVADLIEVGIAAGLFERPSDEDISFIYQDTLQIYIEKGLKDGSIDPIQLQKDIEPLLSDEQREAGMQIGQQAGVGEEPDERAVLEQYTNSRVSASEKRMAAKQGGEGGGQGMQQPQGQLQQAPGGMR